MLASYSYFCKSFLLARYASGAARKIELYVPATTHSPSVKAKVLRTHVPKMYIAATTRSVDTDVPIDLLIVCRRDVS